MSTTKTRASLSKAVYFRMFAGLFAIEVAVEGFGYQVVGRWFLGRIWLSESAWALVIHLFWMLTISTPILYWWIVVQLRRQRKHTIALEDKENEFLSLFSHNSDAVFAFDLKGDIVRINPVAERMLGCSLRDMRRMGRERLDTMLGRAQSLSHREDVLEGDTREYDNTLVCRDGRSVHVVEKYIPIYQDGSITGLYVMAKDVTRQREAEEHIWKLAHHDHLTELPNRMFFLSKLRSALSRARTNGDKLAVLFVDLDRFKNINDALGHDMGDEVLKIVSTRMSECVREGDLVARFGGDEFAVLLPRVEQIDEAIHVAQRILDDVQRCIAFDGYEFFLTSSIGIAMYPVSAGTEGALLRNADTAMFEAKRHGKNRYQIHMPSMHKFVYERFRLENDLRQALRRGNELFLEYQPQVDASTGTVVSVEALLRWRHPVIGVIPPGEFIPLAEETGLIEPLGKYVLREVCRQIRQWEHTGHERVLVAVNVSPVEMSRDEFADEFCSILAEMNVAADLIAIEITESTLMKNERRMVEKLNVLKEKGIRIYVDDFGRGYSSLGFLKQFPVDVVKVDEIFVRDIDNNYEDASVVSAIITLAHSRRLRVIAEGVERKEQLIVLRNCECDEYQGHFFSPSISAESLGEQYLMKE